MLVYAFMLQRYAVCKMYDLTAWCHSTGTCTMGVHRYNNYDICNVCPNYDLIALFTCAVRVLRACSPRAGLKL